MKYLTKFFDKTKLKIRKQENKTRVFQNLKKIGKNREKRRKFLLFQKQKFSHFYWRKFPKFLHYIMLKFFSLFLFSYFYHIIKILYFYDIFIINYFTLISFSKNSISISRKKQEEISLLFSTEYSFIFLFTKINNIKKRNEWEVKSGRSLLL